MQINQSKTHNTFILLFLQHLTAVAMEIAMYAGLNYVQAEIYPVEPHRALELYKLYIGCLGMLTSNVHLLPICIIGSHINVSTHTHTLTH